MHKGRLSVPARAAALLFAWVLVVAVPVIAQEPKGAPPSEPAVDTPAAGGSQAAEPSAGSDQDQRGKKKGKGRARRQGGVPLQPGSTLPPTNLKKVGDHWTPYDPPDPESFPADATLHIIVPGDTLWDLADLVFGNPYLWPQIWNENRYIEDSHWIYPGDPLLLPARPTVVGEVVPQGQEGAPPQAAAPEPEETEQGEEEEQVATARPPAKPDTETAHAPRRVPKIAPLADEYDIRCSGFIAPREEKPDYFIANQEEESKIGLTEGDIVYLNRGAANGHVDPGTEYSAVEREGEVRHPMTHKFLGYYYRRLGSVKVLAAQESTAIATISMACDEIRTGHALVPLVVTLLPAKPAPPFDKLIVVPPDKETGYVVHVKDNQERAGTGQLVDIDMGYDNGLKPGDFLTVFLPSEPYNKSPNVKYNFQWENRRFQNPPVWKDHADNLPPVKVIGQLVVVFTEKRTATVKILNALREIEIGDSVVGQ
ncbi:MAG TPA: LysM peptidoglycan-binding domain-containing protein [Candidatus Polarisedimenticolia bacterium]|nr:LysM peptidoglycan-binding domain-containing protein [Candidatus Polarisedimenticolia bacterium]